MMQSRKQRPQGDRKRPEAQVDLREQKSIAGVSKICAKCVPQSGPEIEELAATASAVDDFEASSD